jgi:TnpA family transposase
VFGTKVIVATEREFPYVLDEILGNQTDLPITEHATDTHGASLINFALFDLVGLQLSPRIRDLGKITLYRLHPHGETVQAYPHAGPLLTRRINWQLIAENWDEMLRLAAQLEVRARHRVADRGQAVARGPAEPPRRGAQGIRRAPENDLCISYVESVGGAEHAPTA